MTRSAGGAGVVPHEVAGPGRPGPQIYNPLSGAGVHPVRVLIPVDGDPSASSSSLRTIAAEASPSIRIALGVDTFQIVGGIFSRGLSHWNRWASCGGIRICSTRPSREAPWS
jgi:hypothetical protein